MGNLRRILRKRRINKKVRQMTVEPTLSDILSAIANVASNLEEFMKVTHDKDGQAMTVHYASYIPVLLDEIQKLRYALKKHGIPLVD